MEFKTVDFETGCEVKQIETHLPDVSRLPQEYQKLVVDFYKTLVVTDAVNKESNNGKDWLPDYEKRNQDKYKPYFFKEKGAAGWVFSDCNDWGTDTFVGSRLVHRTGKDAEYVGKLLIKEGFEI